MYADRLAHLNALDNKAGVLLGFSGVLVALGVGDGSLDAGSRCGMRLQSWF